MAMGSTSGAGAVAEVAGPLDRLRGEVAELKWQNQIQQNQIADLQDALHSLVKAGHLRPAAPSFPRSRTGALGGPATTTAVRVSCGAGAVQERWQSAGLGGGGVRRGRGGAALRIRIRVGWPPFQEDEGGLALLRRCGDLPIR